MRMVNRDDCESERTAQAGTSQGLASSPGCGGSYTGLSALPCPSARGSRPDPCPARATMVIVIRVERGSTVVNSEACRPKSQSKGNSGLTSAGQYNGAMQLMPGSEGAAWTHSSEVSPQQGIIPRRCDPRKCQSQYVICAGEVRR